MSTPVVPPVTPPSRLAVVGGWLKANWVVAVLSLLVGLLVIHDFGPMIEVSAKSAWSHIFPSKFVRAGQKFRLQTGEAEQAGCLAYANALRSGKSTAEAQDALEAQFQIVRVAAFAKDYQSLFTAIVPGGKDPGTPEKREELANAWEEFGVGTARKRMLGGW